MSKLLRNRWLHRALFASALIALGVGIYRVTPPEAMCVIEGKNVEPFFLAVDGRLVTIDGAQRVNIPIGFIELKQPILKGPLLVWDTRTGARLASHFTNEDAFESTAMSRDGRWFAGETHKQLAVVEDRVERLDAIFLLDVRGGTVRELPLVDSDPRLVSLRFSPAGDLLLRHGVLDEKSLRIFDTASGRVLEERDSNGFDLSADFLDDVLLHTAKTASGNTDIEVWDWRMRKPIGVLSNAGPNYAQSPDGRFYVAERPDPVRGQIGKWGVWNLKTCRLESEFESEDALDTPRAISDDGRWLAAKCVGKDLWYVELRELPDGKAVATAAMPDVDALEFSPDGRFLVVSVADAKKKWSVRKVPTLEELWALDRDELGEMRFSRDSGTVFVRLMDRVEILALDCATGARRQILGAAANSAVPGLGIFPNTVMRLTPDRRRILVQQSIGQAGDGRFWEHWFEWFRALAGQAASPDDLLIVADADTCHVRLRLKNWSISSALLSDDGSTLVTVHDELGRRVLRCWDVNAWKPLHWAIGVPAGLGVLGVLWAWRRGRRTRTPTANGAASEAAAPKQA